MFNNNKSQEFFNPQLLKEPIHIVGCGAVGAAVAENLARTGLPYINIWDMDTVSGHNLANQIYRTQDIGKTKENALEEILHEINPELTVIKHGEINQLSKIKGYIFLCVDNIDLRRELCEHWVKNPYIKYITDGRMRLTDGNIHTAYWQNKKEQENLINSMQYTHEEALQQTPVSACGLSLSVVYTPRILASLMVANFVKFINTETYSRFIQIDTNNFFLESYDA